MNVFNVFQTNMQTFVVESFFNVKIRHDRFYKKNIYFL